MPVHLPLVDDHIAVYSFAFSDDQFHQTVNSQDLSAEEKERAGGFHHIIDHNRFVVGRTIVRQVLATLLNTSPLHVPLHLDHGRPLLSSSSTNVNFNITHGGNMVMVAVCPQTAVGIDVEPIRETPDIHQLAERVMSSSEFDEYCGMPEQVKAEAFYRLWVRKESLLKYLGIGFGMEPNRIEVGHSLEVEIEVEACGQRIMIKNNWMRSYYGHQWALCWPFTHKHISLKLHTVTTQPAT